MTSLSKLNASLVSGIQETTLTLANFNFDFSLYKVEAPIEYQGLGNALSKRRRDAAENGTEHVFARKLGALFAQVLPATPNLIRAYGSRATEIAQSPEASLPGTRDAGLFQEWAGADATSIWAAATSGSEAIAVHLLACMLARIWPASEATAIWDEIIQSRKQELSTIDSSGPLHLVAMAAARIEITREQMSSWDASARAWLSIADIAKMREQTQLMLLVKNSILPVNERMNVYSSVMDAWSTAMTTLENVITGMPHSVQDGAALLGLASWHLYPDMYVLGATSGEVSLKDPLVAPGGIITLGASCQSPDTGNGVYWSLPLAYLRFYGDPVPLSRAIGEATTRLSVSEFFQVILGTVFAGWAEHGHDFQQACDLIVALWDYIITSRTKRLRRPSSWLHLLAEAAEAYNSSLGTQKQYFKSLISRGRRRYWSFLAELADHPSPMFGISNVGALLSLISDVEKKVAALRFIAKALNTRSNSFLIRYRRIKEVATQSSERRFDDEYSRLYGFEQEYPDWEYATALRNGLKVRKRKLEPDVDLSGHSRWIRMEDASSPFLVKTGEEFQDLALVETTEHGSKSFLWNPNVSNLTNTRSTANQNCLYECILGDPADAAIFKKSGVTASGSEDIDIDVLHTALNAQWIDSAKLVEHLDNLGGRHLLNGIPTYTQMLRALAAAANVYKLMPGSTISTSIFSKSLQDAMWVPNKSEVGKAEQNGSDEDASQTPGSVARSLVFGTSIDPRLISNEPQGSGEANSIEEKDVKDELGELSTYTMTRAQTFACIAMFENGHVNLDPRSLQQVMALSAGNSIYVAMPLTCDPSDRPLGHEMKRILGNIGRPGISLLIPPTKPKMRRVDDQNWQIVNHTPFNGRFDDSFKNTSLHLSFTRYCLPVSVTSHGDQAIEAHFLETIVSVFDRNDWVADLDILRALQNSCFIRINKRPTCRHKFRRTPSFALTSIDSWNEYLDQPQGATIFRANKNWEARLSAAVLSVQCNLKTVLLRDENVVCWTCTADLYKDFMFIC
jgi:hypothetical protein